MPVTEKDRSKKSDAEVHMVKLYAVLIDAGAALGKSWFEIALCKCGSVHAYLKKDRQPKDIPCLQEDKIPEEMQKHIITRSFSEKLDKYNPIPKPRPRLRA